MSIRGVEKLILGCDMEASCLRSWVPLDPRTKCSIATVVSAHGMSPSKPGKDAMTLGLVPEGGTTSSVKPMTRKLSWIWSDSVLTKWPSR